MSPEIFLLSLAALGIGTAILIAVLVGRYLIKGLPPEPDEHEVMVRPRDERGRWVKNTESLVAKRGPGTPWQRGKK